MLSKTTSNREASEPSETGNQDLSVGQWICKFKQVLLIIAFILLQGCLLGTQLPFIKTTWFAQQHSNAAVNCNDTPKLRACKQGAADLAYWGGILSGISGFAGVVSAVALGSLSDIIGRRKIIAASIAFGFGAQLALAAVVFFDCSLWLYLIAETVTSSFDSYGVWFAMMADLTSGHKAQRGPVFGGAMVACVLLACMFVPLGSLLSDRVAVALSVMLHIATLCLVLAALPETMPSHPRQNADLHSVVTEFRTAFEIVGRHSFMQRMVAVLTLGGVAYAAKATILRPYMMAHFGLDKKDLAKLLPVCAPSVGLCFTLGLWKLVPRFGEVVVLQVSFFAQALLNLALISATETWQLYAAYGFLMGPGLMFIPLINAIKSNLCSEVEQGKVQGLIAAIRGFAVSFADIFFGALYKWSTDDGKHTEEAWKTLLVVLGLNVSAAVLTLTLPSTYPKPPEFDSVSSPPDGIEMTG